ncbi:MAG TPA: CHAP domain-containing protein [Saprospiraceae bacterium]|nr:CHAP domain-containing protein [Lewinellaceae bacterium]HPQ20830.1 CHAP domain-containing protein [Saprospiraceae bacterium]HRX29268.1 CHAP domain-containing protein [Saprospiraceae bacterium]
MLNYLVKITLVFTFLSFTTITPRVGEVLDEFNGVRVFYNGDKFTNTLGRNVTTDGYNLGLKYQCVEFVKRYYYKVKDHKMPNSYGHAKDFFDKNLPDKAYNRERGLMQYRNVREYKPEVEDLIVYDSYPGNPFGHVGIVTRVSDNEIEIISQNFGKTTRREVKLVHFMDYWTIADYHILGWLRKE